MAPTLSDTQLTEAMIENINLWSDSPWYSTLHTNGGQPDVAVRDGVLIVATVLASSDLAGAADVCRVVAAITHDSDTSLPLGILGVVVMSGGEKLAECNPPVK